jgi:hypothetical protein
LGIVLSFRNNSWGGTAAQLQVQNERTAVVDRTSDKNAIIMSTGVLIKFFFNSGVKLWQLLT